MMCLAQTTPSLYAPCQRMLGSVLSPLPLQVQADLQQAVEIDNEEAVENLRNQLAAYCEVGDTVRAPA